MPGNCCQRSAFFVTIAVKWSNLFLCRMGNALYGLPFPLHHQITEKYKQNVDVVPPPLEHFCGRQWKLTWGPFHWRPIQRFAITCCAKYC